jgi:hypothetical protein
MESWTREKEEKKATTGYSIHQKHDPVQHNSSSTQDIKNQASAPKSNTKAGVETR